MKKTITRSVEKMVEDQVASSLDGSVYFIFLDLSCFW